MRAGGIKRLSDVPGSFLYDSGVQVKFLSLSSEELELIPAKNYLQLLLQPPSHLLSKQNDAWIRSKNPGRGRGQASAEQTIVSVMHRRGILAGAQAASNNGLCILTALPWRPTDQLNKDHHAEPLNLPGDGLVWIQENVIILENK